MSIREGGDVKFCAEASFCNGDGTSIRDVKFCEDDSNPNASSYNVAVSNVASSDDREYLALRPCFRRWCRSSVHRS